MDALENILNRFSSKSLGLPYPSDKEMKLIYMGALRAPDHAGLSPSRFIQVTDSGLDRLSEIFEKYAMEQIEGATETLIKKYKKAPYRSPMILIVISNLKDHPKVPHIEQMLSTAASTQNILLALNALGYGAIWRTGAVALNDQIGRYLGLEKNQEVLGYLYIGTSKEFNQKKAETDVDKFVEVWGNRKENQ